MIQMHNLGHDLQGRRYVHVGELKEGETVVIDGGFGCMPAWTRQAVFMNHAKGGGLYLLCSRGHHYLDGQIKTEGGQSFYVGVYPDGTKK